MPISLLPGGMRAVSRREALAGMVGVGVSAWLGRRSRAGGEPGWYALLSDTHVAADPTRRTRDQNMAENLRAAVGDILAQPTRPRAAFIDGDLALKDGQPGDYARLVGLLEPLRTAGIPLHLGLGNHDDRAHFRAGLGVGPAGDAEVADRHVAVVEWDGVRFVMLDSLDRVDSTPGVLGERQLRWLGRALDAGPGVPTVVLVHHNLSDKPGALTDTPGLLEVVRPRRQVQAVVYGHSHRWERARDESGVHLVNLPAVAYAFGDDQPLGWCRFRVTAEGGELVLRCLGGDRGKDRQRVALAWREA